MTEPSSPGILDQKHLSWLTHRWSGPLALVAAAIAMLVWTWGRYCDAIVDFGREIYVAWRLSVGDVLYRDIDYFNGPVSPYLNALIFRVFGSSLLALEIANLLWWTLLCVMAYRLYVTMSDRLSAFVAMVLFIALFSFLQLTGIGNYNFVTPYAHEITHALLCAFGVLSLLRVYLNGCEPRKERGLLASCGLLLGLIFLMKVEVTIATAAALGVGLSMHLLSPGARPVRWLTTAGIVLGAALFPLVVAFVLLRLEMPARAALGGLLGSWKYLGDPRISGNLFYRNLMGLDRPWGRTIAMLWILGSEAALLLPPAILAMAIGKKATDETRWFSAGCAAGYVVVLLWIFWDRADWQGAVRPLNVIVVGIILALGVMALKQKGRVSPRLILQVSFGVFAVVLLSKMFFNVVIYHYGFALTGPAFALVVMLTVGWIPAAIARAGGTAWVFRAAVLTVLGALCLRYLMAYQVGYRSQVTVTVGRGADEFEAYRNVSGINLILNHLAGMPADQTLAAVPQGAMISYLARRINPTGELTLLPGEVEMFGEDRILRRFEAHPPDWIVAVQSDVGEFGYKGFGVDYAEGVAQFIKRNYDTIPLLNAQSKLHLMKFDPGHLFTEHSSGGGTSIPPQFPHASNLPGDSAGPEDASHPR
jgi:hypothetical protein